MFAPRISGAALLARYACRRHLIVRWRTPVNTAEKAVGIVFAWHGGVIRQATGRLLGIQFENCGQDPVPIVSNTAFWLSNLGNSEDSPAATAMLAKGGIAAAL
jgi:hypothetical protein